MALGRHFHLPAVHDSGLLDEGTEKDTGVAVGFLLEFQGQVKIVIIVARGQVTIGVVGAALADEFAVLYIPEVGSIEIPARQVLAVEQVFFFRFRRQFPDLDILEPGRIAMVLQTDMAFAGQAVFRGVLPLAGILAGIPVRGPGIEFHGHPAVQPVTDMTVVKNNPGGIPLTRRIQLARFKIRHIHGIIHGAALPGLQGETVHFFPVIIVNELILRTGDVGNGVLGMLHHVIEHTAVAATGNFPVPDQFEVGEFAVGHDVTAGIAPFAFRQDGAVLHRPGTGEFRPVIIPPAGQCLAIEKQFPAFRFFLGCQFVVLLAAGRAGHQCAAESHREQEFDHTHILLVF